jgi:hypothetical protein
LANINTNVTSTLSKIPAIDTGKAQPGHGSSVSRIGRKIMCPSRKMATRNRTTSGITSRTENRCTSLNKILSDSFACTVHSNLKNGNRHKRRRVLTQRRYTRTYFYTTPRKITWLKCHLSFTLFCPKEQYNLRFSQVFCVPEGLFARISARRQMESIIASELLMHFYCGVFSALF